MRMIGRREYAWEIETKGEQMERGWLSVELCDDGSGRLQLGRQKSAGGNVWIDSPDKESLPRLFKRVPAGVKAALRFTQARDGSLRFGRGPDLDLLVAFVSALYRRVLPHGIAWPAKALEAMTDDDWRALLHEAGGSSVGLDGPATPAPGVKPWHGPRP